MGLGGVLSHGGTLIAGWFIRKNPIEWMKFGGTPILGPPPSGVA